MGYINKMMSEDEKILLLQRDHWTALLDLLIKFLRNVGAGGFIAAILDLLKGTGMFADLLDFFPMVGAVRAAMHPVPAIIPGWLPFGVLVTVTGVSGLVLLNGVLGWLNNRNVVTTKRVMQVRGTLGKRALDSSLEKVNDVDMHQSWMGRMFGFGSVSVMTANGSAPNRFIHVRNPVMFKRALLDAKQDSATITSAKQMVASSGVSATPDVAGRINRLNTLYREGLLSTEEYVAKRQSMIDEL